MATPARQRPLPPGLPQSPSAAFARLGRLPGAFWLDSGPSPSEHARYHHLGFGPVECLRVKDADPFPEIRMLLDRLANDAAAHPIPAPRVVGYITYDVGRYVERLPDPGGAPDGDEVLLAVYDACLSFDLRTGQRVVTGRDDAVQRLLDALAGPPDVRPEGPCLVAPPLAVVPEAQYCDRIARILELVAAGDVYQVNLSRRSEARLRPGCHAADAYLRLRERHPAPYGAFLDAGPIAILSNSPEGFLDLDLRPERRRVMTWPLKGTRPRATPPEVLVRSEKDRAEHVMIVDLERNDLGRIAVPGSVRVARMMELVTHPTVHHLESRIDAVARDGVDLVDILLAAFPGGSVTGTPKVRAMEVNALLEEERRGVYCGAMGSIAWDLRRSRFSIPIRTATVADGRLSVRSGGAVVADSDPDEELRETHVKAEAFRDL